MERGVRWSVNCLFLLRTMMGLRYFSFLKNSSTPQQPTHFHPLDSYSNFPHSSSSANTSHMEGIFRLSFSWFHGIAQHQMIAHPFAVVKKQFSTAQQQYKVIRHYVKWKGYSFDMKKNLRMEIIIRKCALILFPFKYSFRKDYHFLIISFFLLLCTHRRHRHCRCLSVNIVVLLILFLFENKIERILTIVAVADIREN